MAITGLWMIILLHWYFDFGEAHGFGINLIKVPREDRTPIACTVGLLGKYFRSGESLSGSVVYVTTTAAATYVHKSLLQAMHDDTRYPWSIVVKDARRNTGDATQSSDFILHEKPQCYFIVIESIEDENMYEIFEIWKSTVNWNPLAQFVVLLSTVEETEEEMTDIMIEVLLIFMNKKIFNVNVIGQAEESNFVYGKTVFPYHPDNNCGNRVITVETLDICDYVDDDGEGEEDEQEGEEEEDVEDEVEVEEREETNETVNQGDVDAVNNDEQTEVQNGTEEEDTQIGKSLEEQDDQKEVQTESEVQKTLIGKNLEESYESKEIQKVTETGETQSDTSLDEPAEVEQESEVEKSLIGKRFEAPDEPEEVEQESEVEKALIGKSLEEPDEPEEVEQESEVEKALIGKNLEESDDSKEVQKDTETEETKSDTSLDEPAEVEQGSEEEKALIGKSLEEPDEPEEVEQESEVEKPSIGKSLEEPNEPEGIEKESEVEKLLVGKSFEEPNEQKEVQEEIEAEQTQSDRSMEERPMNGAVNELEENPQVVHNNTKNSPEDEISETHEFQETLKLMSIRNKKQLSTKAPEIQTQLEPTLNLFLAEQASDTSQTSTRSIKQTENLKRNKILAKDVPGFAPPSTTHSHPPDGPNLETTSAEKVKSNFFSLEKDAPQQEFIGHSNLKPSTYPRRKSLPIKVYESKLFIEEMYRGLFLDKFPRDLSGCPLVAAYRPWEPYIFTDASEDVGESGSNDNNTMYNDEGVYEFKSYDDQPEWSEEDSESPVKLRLSGIEYKLIQTIGERLHISINMQMENTNVYQLFQQLIDGDIEMVIGGIDEDPIISQYVSSTIPYYQDDLTWCVAKARRSYNLFSFMAIFEPRAWILTYLFIHTASFSIRMSQRLLKFRIKSLTSHFTVSIYVMGTILSQAINLHRLPTSLKISFGAIFFMSLIFSNVYQSILVSTLTTPKSSYQISHTHEIYQNRMHVMGSVDNVRHLNKDGETFRYVREQFQMCYNIEECLKRTAIDATMAVAVSRLHSFYNPRIPRDHLYCFDRNENIYVYLVTMLMPKKFHLLHKINPIIQHIIESGHMQKWARDLDMRRKITEAIDRAHEEKFKSLTLGQVTGPFAFNGFLLVNASLVFALECSVYWLVVHCRTRLKIAKYLHSKFV